LASRWKLSIFFEFAIALVKMSDQSPPRAPLYHAKPSADDSGDSAKLVKADPHDASNFGRGPKLKLGAS
jgi:hypothetical protein